MKTVTPNGKIALVTGANSGIGRETAKGLALHGYHVFLACRSSGKAADTISEIAELSGGSALAEFIELDLADLMSVRMCAQRFLDRNLPLHLLVNNAGLAGQKGLTQSGFELAFGVCHVGHFLLTQLLIDKMKASAPARIVVVSSEILKRIDGIDFNAARQPTQTKTGLREYANAKLANALFSIEMARRLEGTGVTTYALHPGTVATNVWRAIPQPFAALIKRFMKSSGDGATTSLYCAMEPSIARHSGRFYENCREINLLENATDRLMAQTLWIESERWVAEGLPTSS